MTVYVAVVEPPQLAVEQKEGCREEEHPQERRQPREGGFEGRGAVSSRARCRRGTGHAYRAPP